LADAPEELQAVVDRLLARSVTDRFQTPSEAATALANFLTPPQEMVPPQPKAEGNTSDSRESPPTPSEARSFGLTRRESLALVVGALAVLLVQVLGWMLARWVN
jgi:hypothetical protein